MAKPIAAKRKTPSTAAKKKTAKIAVTKRPKMHPKLKIGLKWARKAGREFGEMRRANPPGSPARRSAEAGLAERQRRAIVKQLGAKKITRGEYAKRTAYLERLQAAPGEKLPKVKVKPEWAAWARAAGQTLAEIRKNSPRDSPERKLLVGAWEKVYARDIRRGLPQMEQIERLNYLRALKMRR